MVRFDLEQFIDEVRHARAEGGQQAVHEIVQRAVAQPAPVLAALGEPQSAGFFTLYRDSSLTILNFIWPPLMVLLPHNHRMWATIGIYTGREDNILWRPEPGRRVTAYGGKALSAREVFSLDDAAVHSVVNPIEKFTGAIHVYGGDFFAPGRSEWDAETLMERPFDVERTRRRFTEASARFLAGRAATDAAPAAAGEP